MRAILVPGTEGGLSGSGIADQAGAATKRWERARGAQTMELSEGYAVGPYRLVGRAGSGGMAEVWRAYDARLKRYVAIKFLSPRYAADDLYLDRFRHEAQAISRLDHPNILTIFDYGEQEGWTYMVSPYVGGGTLAAQLRRGPWTVEEAVAVLDPLASALDYAHAEGIVHRDVKPSNVLFTERGRLVLSDFGIARMLEVTTLLSQAGLIVGTPMYMSPEQADGERVTGASDRYCLGVIAYEMLTGRPPFMAETPLALLRAHIDKPLPPPRSLNPALPERIEAALFTILAKDPAHRFQSGAAFVAALRASAGQLAPVPGPAPEPAVDPTLPLDSDGAQEDGGGGNTVLPTVPMPPTRPTSLKPPVDETVPLESPSGVELRPGAVVGALAVLAFDWIVAWFLLLALRVTRFEAVTPLLGVDDPSIPGSLIPLRFVGVALVGLVGGLGVAVALGLVGIAREGRVVLTLVVGWAVVYALAHTVVYLLTGALEDRMAVLDLDVHLAFLRVPSVPLGYHLARLIDVVSAALGGLATAYALRAETPPPSAGRLALGWAVAAALAVGAAWLVAGSVSGSGPLGDLTSGPRRLALVLGIVAGLIQGVVGGWFTLSSLRRRS